MSMNNQRLSQSFDPNTPPPPPPKPSSREISRKNTPASGPPLPPPPPDNSGISRPQSECHSYATQQSSQQPQDPGDQWLPKILEDKSKQDLGEILSNPSLLNALTHASKTAHPSTPASQQPLRAALTDNLALANHLNDLQSRLQALRSTTETQLLSTNSLERQWREKQSEMDRALAPFSPSSLYQRLNQGVQEQEMICRALEESFLEGGGGGGWDGDRDGEVATEREVSEWVRRYREGKKAYYLRKERKDRWDEGRVGGWR